MVSNNQLDMLITNEKNQKKAYIKYYLNAKQIRPTVLDEIIEDLFVIENVLTKNDTLIIIIEDEPNDTILTKLRYLNARILFLDLYHNNLALVGFHNWHLDITKGNFLYIFAYYFHISINF
jgi:hypothetical protein